MDDTGIIRILVADDEALFRDAVRGVLDSESDMLVVVETGSGCEAVALAEELRPDVAILSADLPACESGDAMHDMVERVPECRILVLARAEDQTALMDALEAGAAGFVTRTNPLLDLIAAIRAVHRGEAMVPPLMLGPLLAALIRRRREQAVVMQRLSQLTRREREVLALVCRGGDSRSIAQELVISPETARTHIQNVLSKLGVHSRVEAVALVGPDDMLDQLVGMDVNATQDARPLRRQDVILRRAGGEIILYDAAADRVHFVNPTAAAIWELCDGTTDGEEMVAAICQLTGMPDEIVDEDVTRLLDEFVKANLVVMSPTEGPETRP